MLNRVCDCVSKDIATDPAKSTAACRYFGSCARPCLPRDDEKGQGLVPGGAPLAPGPANKRTKLLCAPSS